MAWHRSGENQSRRNKLNYEGYQVKDWLDSLIQESGVMQIDLARMIAVSPKTVSNWVTGVSFPNPSAAKSLIHALAPGVDRPIERQQFIDSNLSVYESIRKSYTSSSIRYNRFTNNK
ncbi:MAG: XRE family transcriptional regulator [Erysipelotrichia bacterium]|nr:XRE family transcriptional regulator [Erysipelotrichia bacterium]